MFNFSKWSIKAKLIATVLLSCSFISIGSLLAFNQFATKFEEEIFNGTKDDSKNLGEKIAAQFFERYGDIQAFAVNPYVKELNATKLTSLLDEYVKLYGIYDVILVVDKNGHYVASNLKDSSDKSINVDVLKNLNYSKLNWFDSAINEKWTEDKANGFSGTYFDDIQLDPVLEKAYGQKRTSTGFTTVIKNEKGEKVGVITNRANNKWFEAEMTNMFNKYKEDGHPDTEITIINKSGLVISELAPKHTADKIIFNTDYENTILKYNFFKQHLPVGDKMAKKESGVIFSKEITGTDDDLVGYNYIDNAKWISSIGWTIAIHQDAKNSIASILQFEKNYYLLTAMFLLIAFAISTFLGIAISKSLDSITRSLQINSKEVSQASVEIASQSTQLSEASTEQAASLQEIVAAIDEISAMVEKNSEAATKSKDVSAISRDAATRGQNIVSSMIKAIDEINQSNNEVSDQMNESNTKLSEITKLINDIGTKTKVINEIVFQTKLLSFNASVEAARAGEYGKGFAVVAEEVGNLAQMSGNAAKEITDMLEQSIRQVETIVNETKNKVENLMSDSKEKVEAGSRTANECNSALNEILSNVSDVDSLVSEIAVASQEQSTGIREISKAVGQMEEVTQQNSSSAQASSLEANRLSTQSSELNNVVTELLQIVQGNTSSKANSFAPVNNESRFNKTKKLEKKSVNKIQVRSDKKSNVVSFKNKSNSHRAEEEENETHVKNVSGGDFTPSSNDPGFEE